MVNKVWPLAVGAVLWAAGCGGGGDADLWGDPPSGGTSAAAGSGTGGGSASGGKAGAGTTGGSAGHGTGGSDAGSSGTAGGGSAGEGTAGSNVGGAAGSGGTTGGAGGGVGGDAAGGSGMGGAAVGGRAGSGGRAGGAGRAGAGGSPDCERLATDYASALVEAQQCNADTNALPCTAQVQSSLNCGCPTFANPANAEALSALEKLQTQSQSAGCAMPCPAIACIQPGTGVCTSSGSGEGHCVNSTSIQK